MFKGVREKFSRLTDGQQTAVMGSTWVSILEIVLFTWIVSGNSIFRALFIGMMIVTGLCSYLGAYVMFLEGKDEQENVENLEE